MAGVAPAEFPPPVDAGRGVHRPADRSRGRAHRGRRRDRRRRPRRPRLRDQADAAARGRAGADREARRGPGRGDREGQGRRRAPALGREHAALGDARSCSPTSTRRTGRVYQEVDQGRGLPADHEAGAAAEADAAELPQPRQLRHLGRRSSAASSPRRPRRRASTSSPRPRPTSCWSRTGSSRGVRSGDKGRGKDGEELGNFEPGSDVIAKATVLAEGTLGHLTGAALDYFDLHGADPQRWELGVKEVWEVPKPLDRVIHTMGWPLRKRAEVQRVRRQLHLPDGRGQGLHRLRRRPRLHRRDLLRPRRCCRSSRPTRSSGRSSRAASGSPGARRRFPPAATGDAAAASRCPGMVIAGDAAGMVNVPTLKGIHYAMHAGMYAAEAIVEALEAGLGQLRGLRRAGAQDSMIEQGPLPSRATCASRSRRASSSAARSPAR